MPASALPRRFVVLFVVVVSCGRPVDSTPPSSPPPEHAHEHDQGAQGPLVHRFTDAEEWAKQFDAPDRDAWQKPADVVAAMEITPGMTVADVGAGTGYFEPYLSRAVGPTGKVLALDIEPDMVRHLRERAAREDLANVEAREVEANDPHLPAGTVDRVLVVDTWHHILPPRAAYAAKLREGLAPGGAIFIVDFELDATRGPPKEHRLAPADVVRELSAGGLAAEIVDVSLPEQYVIVGRR